LYPFGALPTVLPPRRERNIIRDNRRNNMARTMKVDDIEQLIEQKLLEMIGDPDSGLHLKKAFREKLAQRIKKPLKRISHEEVLKRFA
jgi:hypothetical protein